MRLQNGIVSKEIIRIYHGCDRVHRNIYFEDNGLVSQGLPHDDNFNCVIDVM